MTFLVRHLASGLNAGKWVTSRGAAIPISFLHWFLPLTGALIGAGTVILEQSVLQGHSVLAPSTLRTLLVVGVLGPGLMWVALGWVERATAAAARIQADLASRNRELAALNAVGEAAVQSLDLEEITQTALAKMLELLSLDSVELRLVEREMLILRVHHGVSPDFVAKEKVIGFGHCLCGKCAKTGQVQFVENLQTSPAHANTRCAREGFVSSLSIPMKSKGRVVGVIHVASREQGTFPSSDRETLAAIGNRVAAAVENSVLYEQARRRAVQLETTSLIGQRLNTLLDLTPLLSEVVRLVCEKFGYPNASILLLDGNTGDLVLKEASGPCASRIKAEGLRLKVGQDGIAGWVAHTGQALICNDVSRDPRYFQAGAPQDTRAELAVPLRAGDRVIGVLDVQSDHVDVFNKEDITFLQILGNQLSIALENARLFQETKQRSVALMSLHETSLDVISQLDMPELLQALLRRGVDLLGAHAGILYLHDSVQGRTVCGASYNTYHDWMQVNFRPGEGMVGRVIQTKQPMIVNAYEEWEGKEEILAGQRLRHTRSVGIPLIWQNDVIGVIKVLNESTSRPFDDNDVWLLGLFGDLATIALKNAELHTQVKEFSQHLESKVVERTRELMKANGEIDAQAQELRSLLAKTIRIQEEERGRIARDMHDGVIQLITASKFELRAVRSAAGATLNASAQAKLDAVREVLDEIEKEIRRAIYDLHPAILDSVGLVPALEKYVRRFQDVAGVACGMRIVGTPVRLDPSVEIVVYRLAEEALQNVATHAGARSAGVSIEYQARSICLKVQDSGQGFDYQHWKENRYGRHLGLVGMQERVASLDGEMTIQSELGQGTCVTFDIPIAATEAT